MRRNVLIFFLLFFLLVTRNAIAATVEFSNTPGTFQKEQEATIDVKVAGAASNTLNYLRAAFYPDSTTSYFGYTFNNASEWYSGASPIDPKRFLQIQISGEGTWSGQMKIKPDILSPFFKGNGAYLLKVGRYTAAGSSVTDWSQSTEVSIFGVDPTSTPTPTSLPTSTPTKTPTPTPTSLPTSTPIKTPTPTSKVTLSISVTPTISSTSQEKKAVLGSATVKDKIPEKQETLIKGESTQTFSSPILFILAGLGIITIACGILLFREWRKQKQLEI